jgi:hypothetical protein
LPDIPAECMDFHLEQDLRDLISRDLDGVGPWVINISRVHCLIAAYNWSLSMGEVLERGRHLVALGFVLPEIPSEMMEYVPDERIAHFLRDFPGHQAVKDDRVSWVHLTEYANQLRIDYVSLAALVEPLDKLGINVELPSESGFRLLQDLEEKRDQKNYYTAADLAVYCHSERTDPAKQISALKSIGQFGWDVNEALAFAHQCMNSN